MARKDNEKLTELIAEGNKFNFDNNKRLSNGRFFSEASPEFLAWISKVENHIFTNYQENSGPFKLISSANKRKFSGFYQDEFETEFNKFKGAINSCLSLKPNIESDNNFNHLIRNPYFWTVLITFIGGSYKFGYDNGLSKFDKEKLEIYELNTKLNDSIMVLNKKIDSLNFSNKKNFDN